MTYDKKSFIAFLFNSLSNFDENNVQDVLVVITVLVITLLLPLLPLDDDDDDDKGLIRPKRRGPQITKEIGYYCMLLANDCA